jgi:predicted Zn-dependent protease
MGRILWGALVISQSSAIASDSECIVVDDEIELFLIEIINSVKRSLNYSPDIPVYVVNSRVLNACASQDGAIFVNAGAIMQCHNVKELIAILSHETAHVAGRHVSTIVANLRDCARTGLATALIGTAIGIIAKDSSPLVVGMIGGDSIATHMSLSKMRQKENTADTMAARAIRKLGWPVFDGFVSLHQRMDSGSVLFSKYLSTHPQSEERVEKFKEYYGGDKKREPSKKATAHLVMLQKMFEWIKLKMQALMDTPAEFIALHKSPKNDGEIYAVAVALYRMSKYEKAIELISTIIRDPNSDMDKIHCTEILAMCLISTKKFARAAEEAWNVLKDRRKEIYRDLAMIYAVSVIEGRLHKHTARAMRLVKKTVLKHGDEFAMNLLGKLYAMDGKNEEASLCAAEAFLVTGDRRVALIHAKKASSSRCEITKRRAKDIIAVCEGGRK